jgi:REP element-mobilizing transposase RayT
MEKDTLEPDCFYHIYNRGNNNENIFIEEKNYNFFLQKMIKYLVPIADVYAYCLLKNHFHILLKINSRENLPEKYREDIHLPFSNLFNSYTKSINKHYDRTGSLFQEHLKRNRLEDEEYIRQLVLYIHLNPVKHRIYSNFKEYPHSTFRAYLSDKPTNLSRDYILELFGGRDNFEYSHHEKSLKLEGLLAEIDDMDY